MRKTKVCKDCGRRKNIKEFSINTAMRNGLYAKCKKCTNIDAKIWRDKNKNRANAVLKIWRIKNKERVNAYSREFSAKWRAENREHHNFRARGYKKANRKAARTWRLKHPEKVKAIQTAHRANKLKAIPAWADLKAVTKIYALAAKLRKVVDHIVPLRSKLVCGLHWEGNLQFLTARQNWSKGNRFWPNMP